MQMKCFFKGMGGAILVLLAAAIIVPQYADYRAALETSDWLSSVTSTTDVITTNVKRLKTTTGSGVGVARPVIAQRPPSLVEIADNGVIFLKGGREGQFVVLIPSYVDGKVVWRCIGGPSHATRRCNNHWP